MNDFQLFITILNTNRADIEAIVNKLGLPTILDLLPHVLNILHTVEAQKGTTR